MLFHSLFWITDTYQHSKTRKFRDHRWLIFRYHRHLLKHPVITSFLWMKWHRIRWVPGLSRISGSAESSGQIFGYLVRNSRIFGIIRQGILDNPAGYLAKKQILSNPCRDILKKWQLREKKTEMAFRQKSKEIQKRVHRFYNCLLIHFEYSLI